MRSELATPERTGVTSDCLPEITPLEPPRGSLIATLCRGLIRHCGLCLCSVYCLDKASILYAIHSTPALSAAYWHAISEEKSMMNTNRGRGLPRTSKINAR